MPKWQKTLLVILGLIILPITLFGIIIYLATAGSKSDDLKNDEWQNKQQKKKLARATAKIEQNRKEAEIIVEKRQEEVKRIKETNEEAAKIINDIHNSNNSHDQLDELRRRIDALK